MLECPNILEWMTYQVEARILKTLTYIEGTVYVLASGIGLIICDGIAFNYYV